MMLKELHLVIRCSLEVLIFLRDVMNVETGGFNYKCSGEALRLYITQRDEDEIFANENFYGEVSWSLP